MLACLVAEKKSLMVRGAACLPIPGGGCVYMSEEVPSPDPVGQDLSAEETEAVLGLDADGSHM